MACVVYCLVPDPEQIDPLVERLKAAGVKTEDIAVVPRRHWPQPRLEAPRPSSPSTFADSSCFAPYFWGLSFTPAALWWQWTLSGQPAGKPPRADRHAVIPLELYETKLAELKRK